MSGLTNMQRKMVFAIGILCLFVAMYPYKAFLHAEATRRDLGEATMGDVDTGSFMLKLALLGGARGIAANVLWMKTQELFRAQDWDKMRSTLNLITKLQPHFLQIWTYQSWNLAYNVSVEWDAPEDKYEWIKQGIKFVREGVSKNQHSPDLISDTAWYYYHKLGFADESIILRRLFRDDVDESFKQSPIDRSLIFNDNFQLARDWYVSAVDLADKGGKRLIEGIKGEADGPKKEEVERFDAPPQRKSADDLTFRAMPAHAQTRYAAGLEKESMVGIPAQFGDVAKTEWAKALNEWTHYGQYTYTNPNDIRDETGKSIKQNIRIDDWVHPERHAVMHPNVLHWAQRWAEQMNYPYWTDRCAAEMEQDGVDARRFFYEGTKAYKNADFPLAVQKFQDGLKLWDELLKRHRQYRNDLLNQKDTGLIVERYARACQQLGIDIPKDTPFLAYRAMVENDPSRDPFDALEMISRSPTAGVNAPAGAAAQPPGAR
jgi:hypothetical protein